MKSAALLTVLLAAPLAALVCLPGCVERRITILSNPDGALVQLNDVEVGRTPVTVPFTWYGDYDIVLRAEKNVEGPDGPQKQQYFLHTHRRAQAPWYQWIGPDLFAELLPMKFVDEKTWGFTVEPVAEPPDPTLVERAKDLQSQLDKPVPLKKQKKNAPATARPSSTPATNPAATSQPASPNR